ncbi:uncharacterized protein LOC106080388 [Stomoxys calcitrans]|uniref:uncharacterized protein LOC106080388 n=1 Tax=Stomoxys calcitrans TaxID=35570 RepID=UPI0027E2571A|nr:uncharacterized protein LOC106080388 [Stomoxys calcitrans]
MAAINNPNIDLHIPKWINVEYFHDIVAKDIPEMESIVNFIPTAAIPPGENFTSVMVRLHFDLKMKDGSLKNKTYILKTMLDDDKGGELINKLALFPKEMQMYGEFLPAFENLYKAARWNIQLAPKCLLTEKKDNRINFIFEDLSERNFHNEDRLKGLDMLQMQQALRKLAEFHAASAVYEQEHGPYPEDFKYSFVDTRHDLTYLKFRFDVTGTSYKKAMAQWGEWDKGEEYIKKFPTYEQYEKCVLASLDIPSNSFNVLNHSDFWCGNIMFSDDSEEPLLVDFQGCKWGSPAVDLLFFLTLSPRADLRLKEYDNFVAIYHARLVECLKILGYNKLPIPTLRSLHQDMYSKRNTFYAFFACFNHMPIMLWPTDKNSSIQNFSSPNEFGEQLRMKAYTNPNFVAIIKDIFTFYHQRGLFNFEDYK